MKINLIYVNSMIAKSFKKNKHKNLKNLRCAIKHISSIMT